MRFSIAAAAFVPALTVSAATINVMVGANLGVTFEPNTVTANEGDTIAFQFMAKNHSVTQSTFADPCQLMTTPTQGIDSGFQNVPPGSTQFPEFSFNVTNATTPLWFFCAQPTHCQMGMVFAVNPTPQKTFAEFQATAMGNSTTNSTASASGSSASGSSVSGSSAPGGASPAPAAPTGGSGSTAANAAASSASAAASSAAAAAGGASSTAAAAPASSSTAANSGIQIRHGSAAGVLAVVGLVAGLML